MELVDRIIKAKTADADADTEDWEREIDRLVYELYGLTAEESTRQSSSACPDASP